jgi:N utilization substance protein A
MLTIENFSQVTAQIESERGISKEDLIQAIEQALVSACRKQFSDDSNLFSVINEMTGEASIFIRKIVVEEVENENVEISLEEAKRDFPGAEEGGEVDINVTPKDFGRLAAQTAKQVIIQRIREAEKNSIYDEYNDKVGQIIIGKVQRIENRNYLINLGRVESVIGVQDQIPGERLAVKEKVRFYLAEVKKTPRGPFVHISRAHPGLLKCLFELEIPEIQDGIIEIMSVSREPGKRAKIAVKTNNPAIGAVGTCVGHMGGRIQSIIREIGHEKIDILEWSDNPREFIANSLKPAKISDVIITNEEERTAIVVVPRDQLSLAIGKQGVNVRLAVKLCNWKLDIMSQEEFANKEGEIKDSMHISIIDRIRMDKERMRQEEAQQSDYDSEAEEVEDALDDMLDDYIDEDEAETEEEEEVNYDDYELVDKDSEPEEDD